MNSKTNRKSVSIAIASVALLASGTVVGTAGATMASEPRGQDSAAEASGSWDVPLPALGGQTLAQYVADHWASIVEARV